MILPTEIKNIIFDYVDTETLLKSRINYNDLSNYFIYKYKKKFSNICIKKSKHLNIVNYLIEKNPELFSFTSFKNSEILVKNEFYNEAFAKLTWRFIKIFTFLRTCSESF